MATPFTYPIPLEPAQIKKLEEYGAMLLEVNKQFNLISRGDIHHVYSHHIAHCLTLAQKAIPDGSLVVDWGSGGGLPAIPLAIVWPGVQFVGVDSNSKKTMAIDLFCRRLGLRNCSSWHGRAEMATGRFDYSVSRATAPLADLWAWHSRVYEQKNTDLGKNTDVGKNTDKNQTPSVDAIWAEGLICLKGGDLTDEIADLNAAFPNLHTTMQPLSLSSHDPYFESKCIVHVRAK